MSARLARALRIFLHPRSQAAVYRDPRRLIKNVAARVLNLGLRARQAIWPKATERCNICGWQGGRFGFSAAISVDSFRADELCLECRSNRRTRALIDVFSRSFELATGDLTVADVGAAKYTRRYFDSHPNVKYLVVDRYKDADVDCDITDISLPDDSVDRILCCHVLEHVDDLRKGIEELFRIVKPGQGGVIAVPQTPGLDKSRRTGEKTFEGYGHVWELGDDFGAELAAAGFEVTTVDVPAGDGTTTSMPYHVVRKPSTSPERLGSP